MSNYKELLFQREALDLQIEEARQAEHAAAVAQVRQLIDEFTLTAGDCGFRPDGKVRAILSKAKSAVAPKYRAPNGQTWSGRGRSPKWLTELEAQGRIREEFKI